MSWRCYRLEEKNIEALTLGFENLEAHIQNLSKFNKPVVIAINHFASDTKEEIELLKKWCKDHNYSYAFTDGFINGAKGAKDLANLVLQIIEKNELKSNKLYIFFNRLYRRKNR